MVLQFVYFIELQVLTPALALRTARPGGTGALLCVGQCVVVRVMMEDGLLCINCKIIIQIDVRKWY